MKKRISLAASTAFLLTSFTAHSAIITVDYVATVTDVGVDLQGGGVTVGSNVLGSFSYDTNTTGPLVSFDISIAGGFSATLASPGTLTVQNDQQNGSSTNPADGLTVLGQASSNALNGHSDPVMQFGLRRENLISQLWDDTLPPDLSDWANVTLADVNAADWHWMDFQLPQAPGGSFRDDQLRWDVTGFRVSEVPVPAAAWLFSSGLIGLVGVARRQALTPSIA